MFKKLLIAVFVLGLILTFGTANSSNDLQREVIPERTFTQPTFNGSDDVLSIPGYTTPSTLRPSERNVHELLAPTSLEAPQVAKSGCFEQDYTAYDFTLGYFSWEFGSGADVPLGDEYAMEFDVEPGTIHQLTGVRLRIYDWDYVYNDVGDPELPTGSADIVIKVWDDAGGLPNTVLHTTVIPMEYLEANLDDEGSRSFNYLFPLDEALDMTDPSYHISFGVVNNGDPGAYITNGSDAGDFGAGRGSYYDFATDTWYDNPVIWGPILSSWGLEGFDDPNWRIAANYCQVDLGENCAMLFPIGTYHGLSMPSGSNSDGISTRNGIGQRFTSAGPQFLSFVDVWHYGFGLYAASTLQDNYFILEIWGDDGGSIDIAGGPLATKTSLAGLANLYAGGVDASWQYYTFDFTGEFFELPSTYHITVRAAYDDGALHGAFGMLFSDIGENSGGSINYVPGEPWTLTGLSDNWTNTIGCDDSEPPVCTPYPAGFDIEPVVCNDEFFKCEYQVLHNNPDNLDWDAFAMFGDNDPFTATGNIKAVAQQVNGQVFNRINSIKFQFDDGYWWGTGSAAGAQLRFFIMKDVGGEPGTLIWSVDRDYDTELASYIWPGWYEEVIEGVYVEGDFWIGYELLNGDGDIGTSPVIIALMDNGLGSTINAGGWVFYGPWQAWISSTLFGGVDNNNFMMEADFCAIPIPEATCDPVADDGWATFQGDMARTGVSELAVGDAWCDLTLADNYVHESAVINFASPVIYGNYVVQTFATEIIVFNADLTEHYVMDPVWDDANGDGELIGSDLRCTPTIMPIDMDEDGGAVTPDVDVMFIGGGSSNAVAAVELSTGNILWKVTILDGGPLEMLGGTRYSTFTVYDAGGGVTAVAYGTDAGNIMSRNVLNGDRVWPTPTVLFGNPALSGTTDGVNLFFDTYSSGGPGDVYCLNGADGSIIWQLSGTDGLYADDLFGADLGEPEGFRGGIAYADGYVYMISTANENFSGGQDGDYLPDGVFYKLDAVDGTYAVTPAYCNKGNFNTPIIDQVKVFCPTLTAWGGGGAGNALLAYNKETLALEWNNQNPSGARFYMSGFRTCEPDGVDDLLFLFDEDGFLECYNSVNGDQVFRRRIDHDDTYGSNIGLSGAIAEVDGEYNMYFSDIYGGIYRLKADPARTVGRLQFETYNIQAPAEFGTNENLHVDFGEFTTNTGCFPVTINTVSYDGESYGGLIPSMSSSVINNDMFDNSITIAEDLTRESDKYFVSFDEDIADEFTVRKSERDLSSRSYSSVAPPWVQGIIEPYAGQVLNPGDVGRLIVDVNQLEISRGPQFLYIQMTTDDPDFFLNDENSPLPEAQITLVGGCLLDAVEMHFGPGDISVANISNTTNLGGDGEWTPAYYNINDWEDDIYFSGAYMYAISLYQLAYDGPDWFSNTDDHYISVQADPNYCDDECAPAYTPDVSVGAMWDGSAYQPILADMVCKTWLDSVQNFDTEPSDTLFNWDWDGAGGLIPQDYPFDDTLTMGLMANNRVFGVQDNADLGDFLFEIIEIWNRNAEPVEDTWYFGHLVDWDAQYYTSGATHDSSAIDRTISAAWGWAAAGDGTALGNANGQIKIPFGCGDESYGDWDFNPMINCRSLTQAQVGPMTVFLDSAFNWMAQGNGHFEGPASSDDSKMFNTIAAHNFAGSGDPAGGDTYSFGVANFQLRGLTSANVGTEIAPLAHLINKWAGFGRGDVNDDNVVNLIDIMYISSIIAGGPGAVPFEHLADVDASGVVDAGDIDFMLDYYFNCGPCPRGDWMF